MRTLVLSVLAMLVLTPGIPTAEPPAGKRVPLFDGKTFTGWDGDTKEVWRIEDGCIVGGSLKKKLPQNEFLATKKEYTDFIVRLKFKLLGDSKKDFVNSGVQIRSQRVPKSSEMIGYQCDLGDPGWWGSIYDESRRNKVLAQSNMEALNKVLKRGDWNDYEIRAEGRRIRTYINGVQGVDYTEPDEKIPQTGRIGLQIHSGGPAEVWFKDISIEQLPAKSKDGEFRGAVEPGRTDLKSVLPKPSPLSPEEQKTTFTLPPGFEIELVACEPGIGKPITVVWDAAGRMWTMTALEYPVDANEDPQRSKELFTRGGKDRVLVFDSPYGPGPHTPRTFAEGLAIPLGLLPYKDGAFVQYGSEILLLRDTDGDGRADKRETVLSGFGVEDSHLFPHQFTRGPGNWIYLAQGAFNRSRVKTKEGPVVRWDFCKMARFQPDGSRFEPVEAGLNNIWGFVISREGEMFIQEANDLGYPVVPFFIGANYPGIGMEKLRSYAPWQPALGNDFQMGGTGLSGLALAEHKDSWPTPYAGVFYVANPITRKIQALRVHADGPHHRLEKLPDLLLSSDEWFRPVAIHFGPDGCLYIVDWYNKIISHNEVPRNHPDRDKSRGRIWRVRHKDQPRRPVPNLTKASDAELLKHLGAANAWENRAAWQEIVDRDAAGLGPELAKLVTDTKAAADRRLAALWALEGLKKASPATLRALTAEKNRNLRREALRVLATQGLAESDVLSIAEPLAEDSDPQVRAEVIRTVGAISRPSSPALALLVRMGKEPTAGPAVRLQQGGELAKTGTAHDRDFERYLVRAALEKDAEQLAAFLDSEAAQALPLENRLLATLALEPKTSASRMAKVLPGMKRGITEAELLRLIEFPHEPGVQEALNAILQNAGQRTAAIEALLRIRSRLDTAKLTPLLSDVAVALWDRDEAARALAVRLAQGFKLTALEGKLAEVVARSEVPEQQLVALRALREMNSTKTALFFDLAKKAAAGTPLREEAVLALVSSPGDRAPVLFLELVPDLIARERKAGLDRLTGTKPGAQAIVKAFLSDSFSAESLDGPLVEKLQTVLGDDPDLAALMEKSPALFRPVLRLDGNGHVETEISLKGAFTVEAWVRLDPGISNEDSILGRPGVADFNFYQGHFRFWGGPKPHDVIIAKKAMTPGVWTHVAVTRDEHGRCRLYLNGELDNDQSKSVTDTFARLGVGMSNLGPKMAGAVSEFRVWNHARSADAIREDFDRSFEGRPLPKGLLKYFPGGGPWGALTGNARVVRTTDFPPLLAPAEVEALEKKFAHYRALAEKRGDPGAPERGRTVFAKSCMNCHTAEGKGGNIGPTLNGAGATGTETLLRSLLTPNAAIEGGYRSFLVELRNGTVKEGFLVNQNDEALVLRRPESEDERIAHKEVLQARFTRRSVMPEGLLEALTPEQVADLFTYLRTLK